MAEQRRNSLVIGTDTVIYHDTSEEFSLPDYIPEVRRVLCVNAQALPESKYISGGNESSGLEFGGSITYSLIYTDEDGNLSALPLNSAYEAKAQIVSEPKRSFIDTTIDNTVCRVLGPRKISLKAKLKSRILAFCEASLNENISPKSSADELYIERLTKSYNGLDLLTYSQQGIKLSEKIERVGKPLWCDAQGIVRDIKAQRGSVSVKGDVLVRCLVNRNGKIEAVEKQLSLYEEVEAEGSESGDIAQAQIRCISLSISNEEVNNEESLFFDLECEIECEVFKPLKIQVTEDAYSTKNEMLSEYKSTSLNSLLKVQNNSISLSEGIKRKSKDIEEIIQIIPTPVVEKTEIKGSKGLVSGRLTAMIIGFRELENAEKEYLSESYEIPFKYELDLGKCPQSAVIRALAQCTSINARYEKDMIYINCEIGMGITAYEQFEIKMLGKGTLLKDKELKKDTSRLKIYFPNDKDTLWEIAKKYHTRVATIKEENALDEDSSIANSKLIID